ncbi:MAG: hypothetical protein V4591_06845 [Bdellovibrionota bacterium]
MLRKVCFFIILLIIVCVIAVNIINLIESYGGGAPYYSRTTNMDKWTNPWPIILIVDTVTVVVLVLCFFLTKKRR